MTGQNGNTCLRSHFAPRQQSAIMIISQKICVPTSADGPASINVQYMLLCASIDFFMCGNLCVCPYLFTLCTWNIHQCIYWTVFCLHCACGNVCVCARVCVSVRISTYIWVRLSMLTSPDTLGIEHTAAPASVCLPVCLCMCGGAEMKSLWYVHIGVTFDMQVNFPYCCSSCGSHTNGVSMSAQVT